MAHLAMFVNGLPGLRVTELRRENAQALSDLVRDIELQYFGDSQTNPSEIAGYLQAPDLHRGRGTAGLWEDGELVAALLAFDGLTHEQAVFLDMYVGPTRDREPTIARLLAAGSEYARHLSSAPGAWLKADNFAGDEQVRAALTDDGYEPHRVYQRMRLDFETPQAPAALPAGLSARAMTPQDWPNIHAVVTDAFRDHYDSHPLPLELFKAHHDAETTTFDRWRLVFDGDDLVAVGIGSDRYAAYNLGYVDTLAVLRTHRGRGIATWLLRDAFAADFTAGRTGTALHCDAENLTGATRLYAAVGMRADQRYDAWQRLI